MKSITRILEFKVTRLHKIHQLNSLKDKKRLRKERKATQPIEQLRRFHFLERRKSQRPRTITLLLPVLLILQISLMMSFQDISQESSKLTAKLKVKRLKLIISIKTTRATLKVFNLRLSIKCQVRIASGSSLNSIAHKVSLYGLQVSIEKSALYQRLNMFNNRRISMLSKSLQHICQCSKESTKCLESMNSRFQRYKRVRKKLSFISKLTLHKINIFLII